MTKELSSKEVRWICDPRVLHCDSTKELKPFSGILGQARALSALEFGLNINNPGFNIYVAGMPGTGRTTTIKAFLEEGSSVKLARMVLYDAASFETHRKVFEKIFPKE